MKEAAIERIEKAETLKQLGDIWVELYPKYNQDNEIIEALKDREKELKK
tara:strand:- start:22744 stop:22890 length:147 start_codon:yes stop_codon:yes gene_type:complete